MCGIIGYVGDAVAVPVLIEALKKMEYRGYDSAGVAVQEGAAIKTVRKMGKIRELEQNLEGMHFVGTTGLGHTRWATHGRPSDINAHPQRDPSGNVVVVHNGIIENYLPLRRALEAKGHVFTSQTDTEVIAHLIAEHYTGDLVQAVREVCARLHGAYAIGVMCAQSPGVLVAVRKGSPLVISANAEASFLASDLTALLDHSKDMYFLNDGEIAVLTRHDIQFLTMDGTPVQKHSEHIEWDAVQAQKQGYRHFMLKEIYEQPSAVRDTLASRLDMETGTALFDHLGPLTDEVLQGIEQISLIACGTAWHAALVGRFLIEEFVPTLRVDVDYASEFRYRSNALGPKTLCCAVSQSGETIDTIFALRRGKEAGARTMAICNVLGSSMTREVEGVLYTHAGPEIGVASTKAFTTQLSALMLLAIKLGRLHGTLSKDRAIELLTAMRGLPELINETLACDPAIKELAAKYHAVQDFLYLGRSMCYPIALEGALKLKEISYIHAEGYPAGEMKHGPIALIDEHMPVVVIAPQNHVMDKTLANLQEVKARSGKTIVICQAPEELEGYEVDDAIIVPRTIPELAPFIMAIPLQLLAYHIADLRGCDVDQPRNLAKSVTVE